MMLHNSLLVFVTFNLVGGFDTTLSSCCPNKTVGGISYTLVEEGPTSQYGPISQYGCEEECIYHPKGKPQDRVCFRPGALESMCQPSDTDDIDEISGTYVNAQNKENIENTTIKLALAQSKLFDNLSEIQKKAFFNASITNGLEVNPSCKLDLLSGCNSNQFALQKCKFSVGIQEFLACVDKICPDCGCSLADLLGLRCDWGHTIRFLNQTEENSDHFVNLYASLSEFEQGGNFPSFTVNYNGTLVQTRTEQELKGHLGHHYLHFASMFNWQETLEELTPTDPVATATAIIDSADKLVDVIGKAKNIVLGHLENEIKKLHEKVDGVEEEQTKLVESALQKLDQAEADVARATANLQALAEETVTRVDQMIYYIGKVPEGASNELIAKFLKFEAKKMSELVARSLDLLNVTTNLYTNTQKALIEIKAQLFSFQNHLQNLANKNSKDHEERVKDIRLKVYLPCCIPCPICCAVCAVTLESVIDDWEAAVNALRFIVANNGELTAKITAGIEDTLGGIGNDLKLIIKWQGALIAVDAIDYTFPEAEIFGFADSKPPVIKTLNNLKKAANNYLLAHV